MSLDKQCGVCQRVYHGEGDFLTGTSRWRLCSLGNLWFNCSCSSTLMLKKGKFDWWSPERTLASALTPEAMSVFNRLGNLKDLPHIPSVVMEIQRLLQTPDVDAKHVAHEVRKEPVLATQILQIAESIRNARNPEAPKMRSIEHAIVYVGYKSLSDLIVSGSLRTLTMPKSDFDSEGYWSDCYLTGAIAESLMRRFAPTLSADEVFLAGSLCNLGKLVMAFCFPPLAGKLTHDVSGLHKPLHTWRQAEATYGFPDHCILGEIAAAMWGFPPHILDAARRHHEVPDARARPMTLAEITAAANQLAHWAMLRPHRMEDAVMKAFAKRAHLSESDVENLALEMTKLKESLSLH